jgi:CO/xanthine dehydrogenase FAD-binding subunit
MSSQNSLVVSPTLADALNLLSQGARPVAGGTDLVVGARR